MLTPSLPPLGRASPNAAHCLSRTLRRARLRDKPGGLVVDYLGLADQLKKALVTYTESGGQGNPTFDTAKAIAVMLEKHGIACDLMHGFNWDKWTIGTPTERLQLIPAGQEHILEQEDGKKRWVLVVTELSRAFALCAASDEATAIRDDVSLLTYPPPLGGFALRAACRQSVSPSASRLGSKPCKPRSISRAARTARRPSRSTPPSASS